MADREQVPDEPRRELPGSGPLWARLRTDLQNRLSDGDFSEMFPGELALVHEYGLSRHTVREALRGLRSEGFVTAARGRASTVISPAVIEQPMGALYSLFASVESTGITQRSQVRRLEIRADDVVADSLGLIRGAEDTRNN